MKHLLLLILLLAIVQARGQDITLIGDQHNTHITGLTDEVVLITDNGNEDTYLSGLITFSNSYDGAAIDIKSTSKSVYIVPPVQSLNRAAGGSDTYIGQKEGHSRSANRSQNISGPTKSSVQALLSPVPTRDILTLQADEVALIGYELFDVTGRRLNQVKLSEAQFRHELKVNELSPGQYVLKLQLEDGTQLSKAFIKQ